MKILAFVLGISCLLDILFPTKKVVEAYKEAKKNGADIREVNLFPFIRTEILNILALIFFILFMTKY